MTNDKPKMLCGYCDLKVGLPFIEIDGDKCFCDHSCAFAYLREHYTPKIQEIIDDLAFSKEVIAHMVAFEKECDEEKGDLIAPGFTELFKEFLTELYNEEGQSISFRLRITNLRLLFYKGLLRRQTKQQLTLLYEAIVKELQKCFTEEEDKEDPNSKTIYLVGKSLSPDTIRKQRFLIDIFGR